MQDTVSQKSTPAPQKSALKPHPVLLVLYFTNSKVTLTQKSTWAK